MNIAWVYIKGRPENWAYRPYYGGSEGSMVHYADAFVRLGHHVSIHTPGIEPCRRNGVDWFDSHDGFYRRGYDVVIALRFPQGLEEVDAPVRALYCCDPEIPELPEYANAGYVNLVITISQHQKDRFQAQRPIDESLYFVSNAGVVLADYARTGTDKVPGRCIYCSVPDRGLKDLVEIWPLIHRELPWATLHVTGGFELWGLDVPLSSQPALEKLLTLDGATYLGVVSREDLVREQLESQVLLLPGNPDSPEMCCISLTECMAAEVVPIVTDVGALPERIEPEHTGEIVYRMSDDRWHREFADRAVRILCQHPELINATGYFASSRAEEYDYSVLAPQWLAKFKERMA